MTHTEKLENLAHHFGYIKFSLSYFDPENDADQREEILLWLTDEHRPRKWYFSDGSRFERFDLMGYDRINEVYSEDYTSALLQAAFIEMGVSDD